MRWVAGLFFFTVLVYDALRGPKLIAMILAVAAVAMFVVAEVEVQIGRAHV